MPTEPTENMTRVVKTDTPTAMVIINEPAYFCCPKCGDEVFVVRTSEMREYHCNRCKIVWPFPPESTAIDARELILAGRAAYHSK